jgi:hypothetical protein
MAPSPSQHTNACPQEKLNHKSIRNHYNDNPHDRALQGLSITNDMSLPYNPRLPTPPLDEPYNI